MSYNANSTDETGRTLNHRSQQMRLNPLVGKEESVSTPGGGQVRHPGTATLKVRRLSVLLGFAIAMAAFIVGCTTEPAQTDDGFPSEVDTVALAATAAVFQVQSIASMDDSGSPVNPPRPLPAFSLTDHDGHVFGSADLAGKHVLVSFAYTHCPDVCPALFGHFIQVQRELESRIGDDLEMVIISVDPDRDTPEWLNKRTTDMGGRWHFLTGSQAELEPVWADFGVRVEKQGEFVGHTGVTYLVSSTGELTVRYPAYATFEHFIKGIESATTGTTGTAG